MARKTSFGQQLKQYRKQMGMKQKDIALHLNVSLSTVRKIEAGLRPPPGNPTILNKLADWLHIPATERAQFVALARAERIHTSDLPSGLYFPTPLTSFIGRDQECATLCTLLQQKQVRLVTLTGTGGVGKTRLAIAVAATLYGTFADGVAFVTLATVQDLQGIVLAIARALGVEELSKRSLVEQVKTHLRKRQLLLLLDNFEQLLDAAPLISELLSATPGVKILITSRALLNLYGEHEFVVLPLPLPDLHPQSTLHNLAQVPVVQLFADRACAVKHDFELTNENAATIAAICIQLDGLPLAIELAASCCKRMSPRVLLRKLQNRLACLDGGAQDVPLRHQSLRRVFDWSYDLLTPAEQLLFARLAVFVGGCTWEAVEVVCRLQVTDEQSRPVGGSVTDIGSPVLCSQPSKDELTSLLDKSLLQYALDLSDEPRFILLETIREYALERLVAHGEAAILQQRHAGYYRQFAETAEPHLSGLDQEGWMKRLDQEYDNIQAALAWSQAEGDNGTTGLRLASVLGLFWIMRGLADEGCRWLEIFLAMPHAGTAHDRAKALCTAGDLAYHQGEYQVAQLRYAAGGEIYRGLGDKLDLLWALFGLANVSSLEAAQAFYEECLPIYRELNDQQGIAKTLNNLGNTLIGRGQSEAAQALLTESFQIYQQLDDKRGMAYPLSNLGLLARNVGDNATAQRLLEQSLSLWRELHSDEGIAFSLGSLAVVHIHQGDYAQARTFLTESLILFQKLKNRRGVAACLEKWAGLALIEQQPERAARMFGVAQALLDIIGAHREPTDLQEYMQNLESTRAQLDNATFEHAWVGGRMMSLEQAITEAIAISKGFVG